MHSIDASFATYICFYPETIVGFPQQTPTFLIKSKGCWRSGSIDPSFAMTRSSFIDKSTRRKWLNSSLFGTNCYMTGPPLLSLRLFRQTTIPQSPVLNPLSGYDGRVSRGERHIYPLYQMHISAALPITWMDAWQSPFPHTTIAFTPSRVDNSESTQTAVRRPEIGARGKLN